ncbi:MAG: class I SAM-dependent methyltransferase [Gemmatimonadaceae bacterium]
MSPAAQPTGKKTSIGPAITDVAGEPTEATQLRRLVARYHWAASYCTGKTVLEVACGTGQGLGVLRQEARTVYACDLSPENLKAAQLGCRLSQPFIQADAQSLPVADQSLDVIILLEAIYFLPSADDFLAEARRTLRPGGWCLISAVNKDCVDFNHHHSLYRDLYGVPELTGRLRKHGFAPQCFGIIPMNRPSARSRAFKPIRRLAIGLNMIPESKRARLLLKRIVFGPLQTMPRDISVLPGPAESPAVLPAEIPDPVHQVLLCAGQRN